MKKILSIFVILLALASCDNYLEIKPKGELIPVKVAEYDYLMNSKDLRYSPQTPVFLSGNYATAFPAFISGVFRKAVTYQFPIFNESEDDFDYIMCYKNIFTCNTVIDGVSDLAEDEDAMRIIAEAKVQRAYYFFVLVNQYAKHYNKTTATKDLGIPLILTVNLEADYKRATVYEVYDQIIMDCTDALNFLPSNNNVKIRPDKAAVHGLLSRVYLYMGDFSKCKDEADACLSIYNYITDMTAPTYSVGTEPAQDKQLLLAKEAAASALRPWLLTFSGNDPSKLPTFDQNDKRKTTKIPFGGVWWDTRTYRPSGVSVTEVILNRAECYARANEKQLAIDELNKIRIKRIPSEFYSDLELNDEMDVLQEVFDERERELFGCGYDFFDKKRLNSEGIRSYDLVHHQNGVEVGRLNANDPKWVMDIPPKIIAEFKKDLQQN